VSNGHREEKMSGQTFHHDEHVKGRKDHKCEWCSKPIPKGEIHLKCAGVIEGDFYAYRLHSRCEAPCYAFCRDNDGIFMPGDGAEFDQEAFVNKWSGT
jgi:hypothetical protein